MEILDWVRFFLGLGMLCYGSWTDFKTRRVPNQVWLLSGSIAAILLFYEFSIDSVDYHVWGLLFATLILFYNAFIDEYVLDKNQMYLWRLAQSLAMILGIYFMMTVTPEEMKDNNYRIIDILSISVLMLLMYSWFYFGPTIGGADVKAIMTIGLVVPFTISMDSSVLTAFETRGFPYPFVVFMNSLLLYLLIPVGLLIYNIFRRNIDSPYFQMLFGTKMPLDDARKSFVWPMQQVVGKKVVLVTFIKHKLDSDEEWDKLEEVGVTNPWISFKIPYIIPLTLSFIVSFVFGDLFSVYLVEPINSLIN
jgi:Flp pilus assembly protein protease CpaA|tara:strand:- start:5708 stop:6625 length:918 start_codon:yes stop_codon:yes gene_type:complete